MDNDKIEFKDYKDDIVTKGGKPSPLSDKGFEEIKPHGERGDHHGHGEKLLPVLLLIIAVAAAGMLFYFNNTDGDSDIPKEAKKFENHHYMIYNEPMSWTEAKEKCDEEGGHLVTINSAEEQAFIKDLIEEDGLKKHHYWLGGTDEDKEGKWTWVTDEPFDYTNWDPGDGDEHDAQPNDAANQDYLELQTINNTKLNYMTWNDMCDSGDNGYNQGMPWYYMQHYFGYICEWEK